MNFSNCTYDWFNAQSDTTCGLIAAIISMGVCLPTIILGVVGNCIAFRVFWCDKNKTSTNFLFQALAVIDTFLLIFAIPVYAIQEFVYYTRWFYFYHTHIKAYAMVYLVPWMLLAQTSTIWVTVLVGINRFIAVCKPYQAAKLCTIPLAQKQLGVVLLLALLFNIPSFISSKVIEKYQVENEEDCLSNRTELQLFIYMPDYTWFGEGMFFKTVYKNAFYMLFCLIFPLVILTYLNVRLINAFKELQQKRAEMQTARQKQDNNVTLVLIIVVLVFTVCQVPALLNQIFYNTVADEYRKCPRGFQFYWSKIANTLVLVNSAINFPIYFCFNTRFRQVLSATTCPCLPSSFANKDDYSRVPPNAATCVAPPDAKVQKEDRKDEARKGAAAPSSAIAMSPQLTETNNVTVETAIST